MTNSSPASTSTSSAGDDDPGSRSFKKHPSRQRPLRPDVNARNLRLEKQRREQLNNNLVDIARLLPALASIKRPSKKLVVLETIRHLQQRRSMCICAARDVRTLLAENQRLVSEVNALRSQMSGGVVVQPEETLPPTEALLQLMGVENEPQGEFPDGFAISLGPRQSAGDGESASEHVPLQPDRPSPIHQQPSYSNRTNAPHFPVIDSNDFLPPPDPEYQMIGLGADREGIPNQTFGYCVPGTSTTQPTLGLDNYFTGTFDYDPIAQPDMPILPEEGFIDPAICNLFQNMPVENTGPPGAYANDYELWYESEVPEMNF